MRSRFLVCAALAGFALASGQSSSLTQPIRRQRDAKKKGDDLSEDKSGIGKTLQWEDKVMGPDDKGAELDKIRKAQAINKAAAEKAEKEKAANAAREAKEKEAAAKAGPTTQKRGGEVALPTLPDEGPSKGKGKAQHTEISPKLETEAAKTPPPTLKPADDKFIDKLLKEEGGTKKKRASTTEDKALIDMLASEKPGKAAPGKKGKKDGVDNLLTDADKAAPMPRDEGQARDAGVGEAGDSRVGARRRRRHRPCRSEKPTTASSASSRARPARSSSGTAKPAVATTTTHARPGPAAGIRHAQAGRRRELAPRRVGRPVLGSVPATRVASRSPPSARWSRKRKTSGRRVARARRPPPTSKREASRGSSSGDWDNPFSDGARKTTGTRRAVPSEGPSKPAKAAPARGGKWDDPFTSNAAPGKSGRPVVATREPVAKHNAKAAVTPTSTHRVAAAPAAAPAQGRWGVLKKRH